MNKQVKQMMVAGALACVSVCAHAAPVKTLHFPAKGVVCDGVICANADGISTPLTARYLGEKKGRQLDALGEFDHRAFTFTNGVYCDAQEKVCRQDRYRGTDGKPSGAVDVATTQQLYGWKTPQ